MARAAIPRKAGPQERTGEISNSSGISIAAAFLRPEDTRLIRKLRKLGVAQPRKSRSGSALAVIEREQWKEQLGHAIGFLEVRVA
jgi:hypothetical protein